MNKDFMKYSRELDLKLKEISTLEKMDREKEFEEVKEKRLK